MTTIDKLMAAAVTLFMIPITLIGGLFYPNTLAGALAKFVFSVS